jgi:hypothetical protein
VPLAAQLKEKAPAETGAQDVTFQRGNGDSLYPNINPAKAEPHGCQAYCRRQLFANAAIAALRFRNA